jgi:hypothetical protein
MIESMKHWDLVLLVLVFAGAAFGQEYEIGADVGYGLYRDGSVYSPDGTAKAGIRNRFAAGVIIGDEFSDYVSAEIRYLYHDGHPFLQTSSVKTDIQGQSDTLTYELLSTSGSARAAGGRISQGARAPRTTSSLDRCPTRSRFRRLPRSRRTTFGKLPSA